MLKVTNLTKRFGKHVAVDNVSFHVEKGEIIGLLGPNGAGKTTTMSMVTGFLSSTSGSILINGIDVLEEPKKAKQNLGYLPDTPPLYGDMLVREYLNFICDLKNVKKADRDHMLGEIMSSLKILDVKDRLIKNLSKGYRQRVGLAQALVGEPKLIILDEPMVGLDPKQIIDMRDVIRNLAKKHTLILSSHILSEVAAVCDRVMIINKGKLIAIDTPENLSKAINTGLSLNLRIKGDLNEINKVFADINIIGEVKSLGSLEAGTHDFSVASKDGIDAREALFFSFAKNNLPILVMKSVEFSLEDVFLQVTSGKSMSSVKAESKIHVEDEEDFETGDNEISDNNSENDNEKEIEETKNEITETQNEVEKNHEKKEEIIEDNGGQN